MPNTNTLVGLAGRTSATFGSAVNRLAAGCANVTTRPAPTFKVTAIRPVFATPVATGGEAGAPTGGAKSSVALGVPGGAAA